MNAFGIVGGLFLAAFYVVAAFYTGKRLYNWFAYIFRKMNAKAFAVVYIILVALAMAALVPMTFPIASSSYALRLVGGYLTGILMYVFMFLALADIIIIGVKAVKLVSGESLQKVRFYAGTAAIFVAIIVVIYGVYNATQFTIVTYEVQLQRDLDGEMNIVFISDLHLGEVRSERGLQRIVEYINSLNPDIVCLVGDIFNDDFYAIRDPERASRLIGSINANFGVFACLGNHDTGRTLGSMKNFLEESGVQLLIDEHVIIDDRLVLIGRLDALPPWMADDGFGGLKRGDFSYIMATAQADLVQRGLSTNLPVVVIDHNPTHINEYGSDVDLALFGHTHSGGLFPVNIFIRALFVVSHGHYQRDSQSPHIIVTQGVHGWSIPMRVGTNNEIVRVLVE